MCSVEKKGIKTTAKAFSIPRTTLQRYKKKVEQNFKDIEAIDDGQLLAFVRRCNIRVPTNQVFSTAQENDLVEYVLKCANHYCGINVNELRELAYRFAVKLDIAFPHKWHEEKKASLEWYRKFKRRHSQLTLLDLAPQKHKTGFGATEILPFDPDVFRNDDYIQATTEGAFESNVNEDTQRQIALASHSVGHEIDKTSMTPEPSSSSLINLSILNDIGPLKGVAPKKPSNLVRKAMQSAVLTSPEVLSDLKKKAADLEEKKAAKATKVATPTNATTSIKIPWKRCRKSPPSSTSKPLSKRVKFAPAKARISARCASV